MGAYITNRRQVIDSSRPGRTAEVVEFFVDNVADINNLPTAEQIKETSTAFVIATSEVYVLGGEGWVPI